MQGLPDFLIIGAAKSGTYCLHDRLATHPDVAMAREKEPHFFSFGPEPDPPPGGPRPVHRAIRSMRDYARLFPYRGERRVGESSVSYLYHPAAAERIARFRPDMKLVLSLRDPVDRAYSSFHYARSYGLESSETLWEGIVREPNRIAENHSILLRYRALGLYHEQLQRYLAFFPREQIHVIIYDDLLASPATSMRDLCEFLEIVPPDDAVLQRVNETRAPDHRNPLHRWVNSENRLRRGLRHVLPMSARQSLRETMRRILFRTPPRMPREDRERFLPLFRESTLRLQELIDRDLTSWLQ